MRKRTSTLLSILAAAAWLFGTNAAPSMAPTARAETLSNGYSVTCSPNGTEVSCDISGCPRVHDDEAGDVVHTLYNGQNQQELSKGCNNDATAIVAGVSGPFTLSVQGCRKHPVGSDDCGAWADYRYFPSAAPAAPAAPAAAPAVPGAAPVQCPAGSVEATVPAGQPCAPPHDDVAMYITPQGVDAHVAITNKSSLPAQCAYTATKVVGLGPQTVSRTVEVGPNSTSSITDMLWPPPFTIYDAEVDCTVIYEGLTWPIGKAGQKLSG
ncbi:hypothetical protein K3U94_21775 [Mycolicibacter heraklionensis]|uniref:Secreted protein n=1 Tax=Mycolicibacter heraklionensis TaxID=512402 RepID=A0A9X7ZGG8_9MYCO|nr:hypothetical protein [Mycolicibacter heraklionensis]QZA07522.1 hypothetical protein K3U94_21775 [Mycolicibacter heraklionensis]